MREVAGSDRWLFKGKQLCRRRVLLFFSLLLLAGIAWPPGVAVAQSEPFLTYTTTHDLLPDDDSFRAQVYMDGTVLVHYPVYMKKAGDYIVELSVSDIQQFIVMLANPQVLNFDSNEVVAEKEQIDMLSSELLEVSDSSYSEFEITIQAGGSSTSISQEQIIRWANLKLDSERYPEIEVLSLLAEIEASLLSLADHPSAQPAN